MATIYLQTTINGQVAGTLWQDQQGIAHFAYDSSYHGAPLSVALPLRNQSFHNTELLPYLFGLLPDSERQRSAIAREFGIRPNNAIAMLEHIGLDCPGGVQFFPMLQNGDRSIADPRPATYKPLSNHQIALRLKSVRDDNDATWLGKNESWSLGGNQGKFALAWHNGSWNSALGSAPTTHIFKYGVAGYKLQALNEYVCMRTAELLEIPVAQVFYQLFEDEPALIVKRFDRTTDTRENVSRLHQEDLCQALGKMPYEKYASDGGPSAADILALLASLPYADFNVPSFIRMLFFNVLIGGTDAHAKNYSLLLSGNGALLAPMYDVASGLPYELLRRHGKLAMGVGGENRMGRIGSGAIERFIDSCSEDLTRIGITKDFCTDLMAEYAQRIPALMEQVFRESKSVVGIDELQDHLLPHVEENCEKTLALL